MHDPEGVLKSGMHGPRVNGISPPELANPTQALERGLLNDFTFPCIQRDETIDRAAYLKRLYGHLAIRMRVSESPDQTLPENPNAIHDS